MYGLKYFIKSIGSSRYVLSRRRVPICVSEFTIYHHTSRACQIGSIILESLKITM